MPNTYQICEVTVTLPPLSSITTDGCGNKIKHGDKCRVHLYAVKPDWRSGCIFDGFIVGVITFTGYTESPFKRSQKILMPDGYKLVALRVDDDGVPTSWDRLPVQFVGGLISLNDADGAIRVRIGKIDGAEPFSIRDSEIFINSTNIENGAIRAAELEKPQPVTNVYNINFGVRSDEPAQNQVTISADMFEVKSGVDTNLEAVLENVRKNAAKSAAMDIAKQMAADKKAMDELASYVRTAIMMECFPGGVIWQQCRR